MSVATLKISQFVKQVGVFRAMLNELPQEGVSTHEQ
jgi:hypothetical protein